MDKQNNNTIDLGQIRENLSYYSPLIQAREIPGTQITDAAILAFVYYKQKRLCVLLNKRSLLVEHHKGEISFPGGVKDYTDKSILYTALREAEEEMGIKPADVEIVTQLSSVITQTNFLITPFVGIIPQSYPFKINKDEIDQILEVPLDDMIKQFQQQTGSANLLNSANSFHYTYENHIIWGATANILSDLLFAISKYKI